MLFSLNFSVFAVDTHVFRLAYMLGWIPSEWDDKKDRNLACMHLDFHIPEDLKQSIHQAFWKIGQDCVQCRAKIREDTKEWEECQCPLKDFIVRRLPEKPRVAKRKSDTYGEDTDEDETSEPRPVKRARKRTTKTKIERVMIPFDEMTPEEGAEKGYELVEDNIDDDFGGIIKSTRKYWARKVVEIIEEEQVIVEGAASTSDSE